jgi:hypothetical protein
LENVNIFYGHLEYFTEIWEIVWPFGTFCVNLLHFRFLGMMSQEKIWQPCSRCPSESGPYLNNSSGRVGLVPQLDRGHAADGQLDDEGQRVARQKLLRCGRHLGGCQVNKFVIKKTRAEKW